MFLICTYGYVFICILICFNIISYMQITCLWICVRGAFDIFLSSAHKLFYSCSQHTYINVLTLLAFFFLNSISSGSCHIISLRSYFISEVSLDISKFNPGQLINMLTSFPPQCQLVSSCFALLVLPFSAPSVTWEIGTILFILLS